MRAMLRLLVALVLVATATGCGSGFVEGWREEKEPSGTPEERCERREGYSWLSGACQKDSGLDLGDVTAEEQCLQIQDAGWFDNRCIAFKDLNAEQCATAADWGWFDDVCRPNVEIACLSVPGKVYTNGQCLDRPTLTTDGDLSQTIVAGFAINPITVTAAAGSAAAISSQTCDGFFKLTKDKLESTDATELDPQVKTCEAIVAATNQVGASEPVTVVVTIGDGFLRICDAEGLANRTIRLLMGLMSEATDCAEGASTIAKVEATEPLTGGLIDDLRPFAGLRNMKKLVLSNNRIKDLRPLTGLTNLKYLDIADNYVTDLRPIADLAALENFSAANNPVAAADGDPVKCPKDAKSPGVAKFCAAVQEP